jgi:Domain of unknown function (DUF4836)
MKKKVSLSIACILLIQAISFSQQNPVMKYLPENASMVMSFNPVKLSKKVPGETFRQSFMYRELMKKDNAELKAFMSDPSISGIDFSNDLTMLIIQDTSSTSYNPSIHILGALKNEALFALAVDKLKKGDDSVRVYGTNKILFSGKGNPTIGWNNEIFVVSVGSSGAEREEMTKIFADTNAINKDYDKMMEKALAKIYKIRRDQYFDLLAPHSSNALTTNAVFADLINASGDIKIWNSGAAPNALLMSRANPFAGLMSRLQPLMGNAKVSIINFENGKIASSSRSFINSKMAEVYQKYPTPSQNPELARRLPKGRLLGMMSTSFNPGMGKEMLQQTGLSEILDSLKGKLPFDPSGMANVFGNNMLLAVVQSDDYPASDSATKKLDGIQLVLAIPIADKEKFEKLKTNMLHLWDSLSGTEMGEKMLNGLSPVIKTNDNMMVFSLSAQTATTFLNNPGTDPAPEWLEEFKAHPMVMNLNIHELLSTLLSKKAGGGMGGSEKKMFDMFDKILIYGGGYENGSINTNMEMRFSNTGDNSLKQLFDMVNGLAEGNGERKQVYEDNGSAPPPMEEMKVTDIKVEAVEAKTPPPPPPPKPKKVTKTQSVKKTNGQ